MFDFIDNASRLVMIVFGGIGVIGFVVLFIYLKYKVDEQCRREYHEKHGKGYHGGV